MLLGCYRFPINRFAAAYFINFVNAGPVPFTAAAVNGILLTIGGFDSICMGIPR